MKTFLYCYINKIYNTKIILCTVWCRLAFHERRVQKQLIVSNIFSHKPNWFDFRHAHVFRRSLLTLLVSFCMYSGNNHFKTFVYFEKIVTHSKQITLYKTQNRFRWQKQTGVLKVLVRTVFPAEFSQHRSPVSMETQHLKIAPKWWKSNILDISWNWVIIIFEFGKEWCGKTFRWEKK